MEIQTNSASKSRTSALLNTPEAAAYLGVKPATLEIWRATRRYALKYIKVGGLVKYRQEDLDEFLASRTVSV